MILKMKYLNSGEKLVKIGLNNAFIVLNQPSVYLRLMEVFINGMPDYDLDLADYRSG